MTPYGETNARWRDGDLNNDGVVDLHGFVVLKADFGNGAAAVASVALPASDAALAAGAAIDVALVQVGEEDD